MVAFRAPLACSAFGFGVVAWYVGLGLGTPSHLVHLLQLRNADPCSLYVCLSHDSSYAYA